MQAGSPEEVPVLKETYSEGIRSKVTICNRNWRRNSIQPFHQLPATVQERKVPLAAEEADQ